MSLEAASPPGLRSEYKLKGGGGIGG